MCMGCIWAHVSAVPMEARGVRSPWIWWYRWLNIQCGWESNLDPLQGSPPPGWYMGPSAGSRDQRETREADSREKPRL